MPDVEALSRCMLMWRSFTHWIGGMGVLVFILAVLPLAGGYNIHIMRAESPGPSVGKLVPRVRTTAKILYSDLLFHHSRTDPFCCFLPACRCLIPWP